MTDAHQDRSMSRQRWWYVRRSIAIGTPIAVSEFFVLHLLAVSIVGGLVYLFYDPEAENVDYRFFAALALPLTLNVSWFFICGFALARATKASPPDEARIAIWFGLWLGQLAYFLPYIGLITLIVFLGLRGLVLGE
jgi:hypothetical protein